MSRKRYPPGAGGGGVGSVEECEGKAEVVHMVSRHGGGGAGIPNSGSSLGGGIVGGLYVPPFQKQP